MTKPEWGSKLACTNCGASFYSMKRADPSCPKCSSVAKKTKPSTHVPDIEDIPPSTVSDSEADDLAFIETDELIDDADDEDTLIVDASDLGDDDDDMSELKEHMEPGDNLSA